MGTAGRGGQSVTAARGAMSAARMYEAGIAVASIGAGVYPGAKNVKGSPKRPPLEDLLAEIRRFLRATAGRDKDLAPLLGSDLTRRCYELVLDLLFEAASLEDLKRALKEAGADPSSDWQYDLLDWMKGQVEAAARAGEEPTHLDWLLAVLEQMLTLMLPTHDLYADPPALVEMQKHCAKLKADEVARTFYARLLYLLLEYHFSHVSALMPQVPIGMIQQDLLAACERLAAEAYALKPEGVGVSDWFGDVQANVGQYVEQLVKERKAEKEAA